jgi:tetratricopeptide (TPR) repeat protein
MADHRRFFRPRRLAFGGRLFPRGRIFGAAFVLLSALGPALAEDAGLKSGAASLAAGKYDNAVRQLSATVNSENASPGEAAKTLYLRGIAYRKLGQPARALADLGAAIWLGLSDQDRVKALVNRGLAFQAAGLASQGEAELAQARKVGGSGAVDQLIAEGGGSAGTTADIAAFSTEVRPEDQGGSSAGARASAEPMPGFNTTVSGGETAPPPSTRTADASPRAAGDAPSAWSTSVDGDAPKGNSGNRLTRWFGSLSDSSESSPAEAPSQPAPAQSSQPRAAAVPPPAPANSSWTTNTETQDAASGSEGGGQSKGWGRWFNKTADAGPPAEPAAPPPSAGGGGYRLQLATSQSEEKAKALYKKVASQNPELAAKQPDIEKVDIGNFGTFYSLKIGPFQDKAESLKLCNALKRSGVDCLLATP